uniref:Uncharacterized protein n=1 Tax=Amphimedon queenslandica TaxID=400682 RepID=A0A1X7VEZ7_AMPQE
MLREGPRPVNNRVIRDHILFAVNVCPIVTQLFLVLIAVLLAADTLGQYKDLSRLLKVNDTTVAAGSGDYADFQYIARLFESLKYCLKTSLEALEGRENLFII